MVEEKPTALAVVRDKASAAWEWVVDTFWAVIEASKDILGL